MSYWTHIVAIIDVDTIIQDKNIKEIVEEMLIKAPRITGSEGNADVFVNLKNGHNIWTNCDCKSCEFKDTIIHHKEGGFSCESPENYKCLEGEYQTRIVISVIGDLRDREKETTKEEYEAFLKFLKKDCDFDIRNKTVNIIGN